MVAGGRSLLMRVGDLCAALPTSFPVVSMAISESLAFVGTVFCSQGPQRDVCPDPRANNNAFSVKHFDDQLREYTGATAEGKALNKLQSG